MCLVKIRTTAPFTGRLASNSVDAIFSMASRCSRNCPCRAVLGEPRTPASSSIAASLIWQSTVSPSFSMVNPNARRSSSYPTMRPRVSGIERFPNHPMIKRDALDHGVPSLLYLGRFAMHRIDPQHRLRLFHRLDVEIDRDRLAVAAHQYAFQHLVGAGVDLLMR